MMIPHTTVSSRWAMAWGVKPRRRRAWMPVAWLLVLATSACHALTNSLALTPPMGWNSWNNFACGINESLIRSTADAMATNGLKYAGYQFINLDDCWQVSRDPSGVIVADPVKFPSGIKALADYVHSKGLKLGLYSDHGLYTCAGRPGGYGYEYLDANTYASWGVDYLKYDNCALPAGDIPRNDYFHMSDALLRSGRSITFSICAWTFASWDPDLGNLWRTTGDISDSYASMISKLGDNSKTAYLAGPGRWNDPDMLEVGRGGMTTVEDQAHFTLWCIMAAPLIAGNNLTNMSPQTLAILTNPEVIAVDQDPAGEQGIQVAGNSTNQIWCKPLGTDFTTKAVALFNNGPSAANMTVNWTDLGLQAGTASLRDLWARMSLGNFVNSFTTNVPSHGSVMLKVVGAGPALPAVGTTYLSDLQPAYSYVGWGALLKDKSIGGNALTLNGVSYSKGLGTHAFSGIEYRLGAIASRFQTDIGLDDEVGASGSVVFQVFADGTKIYDSGILKGGAAHQTLDLDVTGAKRLTLGVGNADDSINFDHADWAGARIIVSSATPKPLPAPSGLAASRGSPVVLTWNPMPGAASYNVKRATVFAGPFTNQASVLQPAWSDSTLAPGATAYYAVSTVNDLGESTNSTPVGVTACLSPSAPVGLVSTVASQRVSLGWIASADATGYIVARATCATPYTNIAVDVAGASFADTNVVSGMVYYYVVAASNACSPSAFSAPLVVATPPAAPTGLLATPADSEVVLSWSASPTSVGYNVKRSAANGGPYVTIAANVAGAFYVDSSRPNGVACYYVVSASNPGGESANSAQAGATPCGGGLPGGWTDQDIGGVGLAGGASCCSNAFALLGGGSDIWGAADSFNFASTSLAGDVTLLARVTALQSTDPWAKAGVMLRNDTGAGAVYADVFVTPVNGVSFQWRTAAGGQCGTIAAAGVGTPVWVKLTRSGSTFSAYYGADGLVWRPLGATNIVMAAALRGGLAVCAHNNSVLCQAAFDNVTAGAMPRPRPVLSVNPLGGELLLTWPGWATGQTVWRASNLLDPVQWLAVTNAIQSNNGSFNLAVPAAANQQFFRLSAP